MMRRDIYEGVQLYVNQKIKPNYAELRVSSIYCISWWEFIKEYDYIKETWLIVRWFKVNKNLKLLNRSIYYLRGCWEWIYK